jgi:hypothetical protein
MFTKVLYRNTQEILDRLSRLKLPPRTYLAGGTGLALQLGHRISVDLDFFTPSKFDPERLAEELKVLINLQVEQSSRGTILGSIGSVRFSLFRYDYPVLFPFKMFCGISVADLKDIAPMKMATLPGRGKKRDFVDMYFLCRRFSLKKILALYRRKYRAGEVNNLIHLQKSLVYFPDAEADPMPRMLRPIVWEEIKRYFEKEVQKIWRD